MNDFTHHVGEVAHHIGKDPRFLATIGLGTAGLGVGTVNKEEAVTTLWYEPYWSIFFDVLPFAELGILLGTTMAAINIYKIIRDWKKK